MNDALHTVQEQLQTRSESPFLWDAERPRPEEMLSHWVSNRLHDLLTSRGIVANREVQIRPSSSGRGIGPRTDIHIDAVTMASMGGHDRITVVIEAKGIWHADLFTAMERQLTEHYLISTGLTHGVYLVFCPDTTDWDPADSRRQRAQIDLAELQNRLRRQAKDLQSIGVTITPFLLRL